ncbi:MAG: ArnT family glycosyltransferase [Rhodanobacteraceae bacterium]
MTESSSRRAHPPSAEVDGMRRAERATARRVAFAGLLLVAAVVAFALARLCVWAWTQQVSFDGAMNLEIARSIADGHGYRRLYSDHTAFSHAIQTRAPFIVPAAAVFAVFGVGIWQAQLTNLLYVFALGWAVFVLFRRHASWRWGLLAVAVCFATPGLLEVGMNGYGEVPAFVWWLAGLLVLYRNVEAEPVTALRCVAAGFLFGVAIVTKTVLLIGFAAIVPVWLVHQARLAGLRSAALGLFAMLAGLLVPILGHEIWHAIAVHDLSRWRLWLDDEWRAIHMQAGTRDGFFDTPAWTAKITSHLGLLSGTMKFPAALLSLCLVAWAALVIVVRQRLPRTSLRPVLLTLALFAALYLAWWLAITPTQKAWHRRVFDGLVAFELVTVFALYVVWKYGPSWTRRARTLALASACVVSVGITAWCMVSLGHTDWPENGTRARLDEDLAAITRLGNDAHLYGAGWYSAPVAALYSGRALADIVTTPPAELAAASPVLLVLDPPARKSGVDPYWTLRYPHEELPGSTNLRIESLVTDRVSNPFESTGIDAAQMRAYADFHAGDYPYLFGFYDLEGGGWRWARADVEALLRYSGEAAFKLDIYTPSLLQYQRRGGLGITVWIGDCRLGVIRQDEAVAKQLRLPMDACPLAAGDVVRVRLVGDNMLARNDRQLSFIVNGLGFDSAPAPVESAR